MSKETNDAWVNAHYGHDAHPIADSKPAAAPVGVSRDDAEQAISRIIGEYGFSMPSRAYAELVDELMSKPAAPGIDHLRSVINALSRNISDAYETACNNGDERMQTVQNARQSLLNTIREALPQSDTIHKGE